MFYHFLIHDCSPREAKTKTHERRLNPMVVHCAGSGLLVVMCIRAPERENQSHMVHHWCHKHETLRKCIHCTLNGSNLIILSPLCIKKKRTRCMRISIQCVVAQFAHQ